MEDFIFLTLMLILLSLFEGSVAGGESGEYFLRLI
jgi:hypothetical protein